MPGIAVDLPALTEKDKRDLEFGIKNGIDFIAPSFIRSGQDVEHIRKFMREVINKLYGQEPAKYGHLHLPHIISKIENQQGLDNFENILDASDAIMVARGDLGVEIPVEQVFRAQKWMIAQCNKKGKPCITATQMLESMITHPRPTRAEVTDVANAVLDGSDSVMLSGETAKGAYPTRAVDTMARICRAAEADINYSSIYAGELAAFEHAKSGSLSLSAQRGPAGTEGTSGSSNGRKHGDPLAPSRLGMSVHEAIAIAAVKTSWEVQAACIIALTETGQMARAIARLRPIPPVLAVTASNEASRKMQILRGVYPLLVKHGNMQGTEKILKQAMRVALADGMANPGDPIVITSGLLEAHSGGTNMLRVLRCAEAAALEEETDIELNAGFFI